MVAKLSQAVVLPVAGCKLQLYRVHSLRNSSGVHELSAAELELVINTRLEQAAIARQRHHGALAARIVLSAMSLMQDANIFKERHPTVKSKHRYASTTPTARHVRNTASLFVCLLFYIIATS